MSIRRFLAVLGLAVLVVACGPTPVSTAPHTPTTHAPTAAPLPEFWSEKGLVLTAADFGHPEDNGQLAFADSEIVRLPDGRLRIYMFIGSPNGSGPGHIGSMVSSDGLHWILEPGDRCSMVCGQIAVVQSPSVGWKIFSSTGDGIRSATSADGLSWKDDTGVRVSAVAFPGSGGQLSGPHITPVAGGGWRMYFHRAVAHPSCGPGTGTPCPGGNGPPVEILSAFSTDLVTWTPDAGVRTTAGPHPNVIALPSGGYQMFTNPGFDMLTATSNDGLTWPDKFDPIGLQGGDPVPVLLPAGRIRLYYNDADAIAHNGGGLFWAEKETATWDVEFRDQPTIDVTGSGGRVTVRLTDHGRSQDRPSRGLPYTGRPPFSVSIDLGGGNLPYQPVIEITDSTMNRFFDGYACGLPGQWSCPPQPGGPAPTCGNPCLPTNCSPAGPTKCPRPLTTVQCQKGQPISSQGCITTGYDGLPELCLPKGLDPFAPPVCDQFY